ncbi:MAG: alpha-glucan family phosphorylase [Acidobacteria bacterium]|nr:alpha-glucan family phosphorylase [Acidobacteriota bacterium]
MDSKHPRDVTAPASGADEVAQLVTGLRRLASNLWWTWNEDSQVIFHELSPRGWQTLYHNAVAVLQEVSEYELKVRLQDPSLARRARELLKSFDAYLSETDTWGRKNAPSLLKNPVAYFSAEIGFHETLPIAAGGLGILAGDHARSASDLGIGFVGMSIFYREGYFQQAINQDGWQTDYYVRLNPESLPMEPVLDTNGEPVVCSLDIDLSKVYFHAWRVNVGRIPVYLLDTNRPENQQLYRDLSLRVYGGDNTTRIMQELLLGMGGVRLLRRLGIQPSVFHKNEGHVAFLALELIREKLAAGMSFDDALQATRRQCIFTTHTPVQAGHDRFSPDLVKYALHELLPHVAPSFSELMALGRVNPQDEREPFCMTVLALKASRAANGVSELHGHVSRLMWQCLYPRKAPADVPIGHITNGIHLLGWMKGPVRSFWKRKLGPRWDEGINSAAYWERMLDPEFVSDEELWALRYRLRRALIEFARRRLERQGQRVLQHDFIAFDRILNPDALTIGFARRFAAYKRAPLIFRDIDRISTMVLDDARPIQFVFAGKAHPMDDAGKTPLQKILQLGKSTALRGRLVFLENYDVHVARQMVSGCDLWLNNPRRPMEASGTSGMKISCNGGLNLSVLDGWWCEGYDGTNGFAIASDENPPSTEEQDRIDSENLYRVLSEEVIPCFYDRDASGIPRRWISMMRRAMATLVPQFNTWRMVQEYTQKYYLP